MVNTLQPINLTDWTGGLNLRRNQFQLADNESPDMLNVDVDPRGGFCTRKGWLRWNDADIVDLDTIAWMPHNAAVHNLADGNQIVYVVNGADHKIHSTGAGTRVFAPLNITANATPHCGDFAPWGDYMYIACGAANPAYRRLRDGTPQQLANTFSEIEAPTPATFPRANYACGHGGYMFCASTIEAGASYPARIRWSHPGKPDSWRDGDYLDIEQMGGRITGIMSFRDHLLIFKTNSLWALYGYSDDSWQLIKVAMAVGCPSITCATRSETAVYFFSSSNKGGIYGYSGEAPVYISEQIRPALEEVTAFNAVFVSWAGRRLWIAVPWMKNGGATVEPSSVFIFDPDIGNGAWSMYNSVVGTISPVVDAADVDSRYPLTALWSDQTAAMVVLDRLDEGAYDAILEPSVLGTSDGAYLSTGAGQDLAVTGRDPPGEAFDSYYRTRWLHAGWPDRKKSWRRPTFVVRQVPQDVDLIVESFRNYNETEIHRTRTLRVEATGSNYWTPTGFAEANVGGFDWTPGGENDPTGTGADWGPQQQGSNLIRAGSMGLARSIQMRIRPSPTTMRKWGVDGIVAKIKMRRFR